MPLYIKIDFRTNGALGAWWSRNDPFTWGTDQTPTVTGTKISETRLRDVLLAIADEIDPVEIQEGEHDSTNSL